ncbi:hypothetical protein UFOVP232_44 [uncultured Caudovirales phage]|uniref:Uncharacterized protein n=1 Tax=uncultured Caudovirales phage TaxID=2100421 RepID=A0A6J7WTF5_9CAUD|nr:hypothetical protein UFOVP232_44 [uncultured Caudovirales phage]
MAEKIKLVQGDTKPALVCNITDETTGSAIALTGATAVLKFRAVGASTLTATVTGSVTDAANGQVAFFPASAPEMLQGAAGDYEGEIQITFADNTVQTVYDLLKFKVREDF